MLIITNVASLVILKNGKTNSAGSNVSGDETLTDVVEKKDEQAASVAGAEITYEEWLNSLRETYGKSHLKEMINEKVVHKLAEEKDIFVSDKVIDREIAYLTTMSGIMEKDEITKQQSEWEKELLYRYQLEALLTEEVNVPEEEVRSHYEAYQNQYDFSPSFQLSHITVSNMKTAEKVIDELEEGASFHLLAKEYSLDEETKENGGYIGYFTTGSQFVPYGYDEIISDMDEHSYSDPVSLGDEVVIIYLHRYLPGVKFTFDELKEHIERELAYEKVDPAMKTDDLWNELNVEWIFEE